MEDYYKVLGVSSNATKEEIKKAYRKLAHQYHPDKGGDPKTFQKINEAYQVLSNEDKRAQYDRYGTTFEGAQQGGGAGFGGFDFGSFWEQAGQEGGGFDYENLGDIFEEFFGSGFARTKAKKQPRRGADIQVDIEMDLEETLQSREKTFSIYKLVKCSRCNGNGAEPGTKIKECSTCRGMGQVQQIKRTVFGTMTHYANCPSCKGEGNSPEKPCNVCKGEGRIKQEQEIKVVIPAGVDSGQMLQFRGQGNAGKKNGPPGDLYVRVFVKPHSAFQRRGDDLYTTAPMAFSQIVLGDKVKVPGLGKEKPVYLKVPAGTQPGKIFRISDKGIPKFSGYGRGNLYVKITIATPKRLTRRQKELLKKLKEEGI